MSAAEVAAMREEVAALAAELAGLRDVAGLFYEQGRADALCIAPRVKIPHAVGDLPARHLSVVRS
jgi:hypothetical protein